MKTRFPLSKLLPMLPGEVASAVKEHINPDDAELRRKGTAGARAQIEDGERAAIQVISTRDIDRDGEILDPKGAVLTEYLLNPVVMWNHDYSLPPIGSSEWVKASADTLTAKTLYSETPFADEIYTLKREGHLRAASVGFVPLEFVWNGGPGWSDAVERYAEKWAMKPKDFGKVGAIHTKWLLLEHSDVPIPANPHALVTAVGKGLSLSPTLRKQFGIDEDDEQGEQADEPEQKAEPEVQPIIVSIPAIEPVRVTEVKVSELPRTGSPIVITELARREVLRRQGRV